VTAITADQREEEAGLSRFCGAAALIVLFAVLAGSAGGLAATGNSFCDIETSAVCAEVVVQKTAENTCTVPPDTVTLTGTIHVAVFQDENQARIHTNWQDVAGVGVPSGALYQANEATRLYEIQHPSGAFTFVLQDERELLSQGELQNFVLREYMEITVDENGVTIKTRGEPRCTG
jgi:hypothetical protein